MNERVTGGKTLVKHQATALALADMATALEAARLLVWKAAWAKDHPEAAEHGHDPRLLELMAAMNVGDAVHTIIVKAMELFGGAGVITGMPIEKYARDSFVQLHVSFPTSNRLRIAESLVGFERRVPTLMPL
ncbi:MAG: acyl-CoA dehydrogenase family protein [Sphingobium sp.]|nr:acyl-CoA dehydrogenase family protein [Sphingobium sp.]